MLIPFRRAYVVGHGVDSINTLLTEGWKPFRLSLPPSGQDERANLVMYRRKRWYED